MWNKILDLLQMENLMLLQYKPGLAPLLVLLKLYMTKVEIQEILPIVLLLDNLSYYLAVLIPCQV